MVDCWTVGDQLFCYLKHSCSCIIHTCSDVSTSNVFFKSKNVFIFFYLHDKHV